MQRNGFVTRLVPVHLHMSASRFYIIGELLASFIVAGFATTYWGAGELRPPVACIAADL